MLAGRKESVNVRLLFAPHGQVPFPSMVEVRILDLGNALDEDYVLLNSTSFGVGEEEGDLRVLFHVLNLAREEYTRCYNELGRVVVVEE